MDNGMVQIGQISLGQSLEGRQGVQLLKLTEQIFKLVQVGDLAVINIEVDGQGNAKSTFITNGKEYLFPLDDKTMQQLSAGKNVEIPVRIGQSGKLIFAKNTANNVTMPQETAQSQKNVLASVEVAPVKVKDFVDQSLQKLDVPQNIRQQLTENLSALKVSMQGIGVTQTDENVLLQPLTQLLQQVAQDPKNIPLIKTQLMETIEQFVGAEINGSVSKQINDLTGIKTPLGETFFESKIKLPLQENVILNIDGTTPKYEEELHFLDLIIKNVLPQKVLTMKPETIASSPQLKSLATTLAKLSDETATEILNQLPLSGNKLFENIYNLYQATENKDIGKWLGKQTIRKITTETNQASNTLKELQNFASSMVKETPMWKIVEMPLFDGNQFSTLKVAVKKDPEQQKNKAEEQKNGTRFIVETNFSKLGSFQFDGLSHADEKRLDLIIRTSVAQTDDFCRNLINLFKKSLYDVNYTGTIKINREQSFVNLREQSDLSQGIYV